MDGKSLSGWMTFDPHAWSIDEEGLLVGKGAQSFVQPEHLSQHGVQGDREIESQRQQRCISGLGWVGDGPKDMRPR